MQNYSIHTELGEPAFAEATHFGCDLVFVAPIAMDDSRMLDPTAFISLDAFNEWVEANEYFAMVTE